MDSINKKESNLTKEAKNQTLNEEISKSPNKIQVFNNSNNISATNYTQETSKYSKNEVLNLKSISYLSPKLKDLNKYSEPCTINFNYIQKKTASTTGSKIFSSVNDVPSELPEKDDQKSEISNLINFSGIKPSINSNLSNNSKNLSNLIGNNIKPKEADNLLNKSSKITIQTNDSYSEPKVNKNYFYFIFLIVK